ncbi:MAG: ABC transporter permease [Gemmatimonadetes bacterium]|nr:ABC transporter permease [Gemmatimonadota bacterium]NNF39091.1 ABC transporter permease [Gemmatimonadota bacterium]
MRPDPPRTFRRPADDRAAVRREVDEELDHHLELRADELVAEGWDPAEARLEAERRFGDLTATRAYCTQERARARAGTRRGHLMDELRQDLKYALRTLRIAPGYAAVVVATLAVGIALNTLVFSLMNPYLVRALPYADAERLVAVGGVDRLEGWDLGRFSRPQIADLAERSRAFEDLGSYYYGVANLVGDDAATRVATATMSGNLFDILGVDAARGRTLTDGDAVPGADAVTVLSHAFWTRQFGGDPGILGRSIRLDGEAHTVVGVMPPDFNFPYNAIELWVAERDAEAAADRSWQAHLVVGRLADGWTGERAREELTGIQLELARRWPDTDADYEAIAVKPMREALNFAWAVLQPAFLVLLAGVGLVLLIACVNVASLTLARSAARGREVAVRAAVGASRGRLVRQLLVESVVLAGLGGLIGIGLAVLGTQVVSGLLPDELFRVGEVAVDRGVLTFSLIITLVTPMVFGLAPALIAARGSLAGVLRGASGAVGGARATARLRSALVVVQVTLAVVLVASTGLMVRSFVNAVNADLGFAPEPLLIASVTPPESSYPDAESLAGYYRSLEEQVAALPGVAGVGTVSHLPLNHETIPVRYTTPEGEGQPTEDRPSAFTSRAGPGYFEAMGIPLREGRVLRADDRAEGVASVIVTESLADRLWPEGGALGRTLVYGSDDNPLRAIVAGVVGDVRYDDLAGTPRPHVYRVLEGTTTRRRFLVIQTAPGITPSTLTADVRAVFKNADPDLPLSIQGMPDIVRESTGIWAMGSGFLAIFGLVATALAALGIYGLVTFSVQRRQREMGLRLALGADAGRLQWGVVAQGLRLTTVGLVLGLLLALAAGAGLAGVVLGVGSIDPPSLGGAAAVFTLVAAAASWLPARKAARIDPVRVLRSE